ncbi:DNAPol [Macrobrachium rosenbergii nudivirus]|nr:DNAPol [Macrobrachium rosenbergii nudivirus]
MNFNTLSDIKDKWVEEIPYNVNYDEYLFILDWHVIDNNYFGVGINPKTKKLEKFKLQNIQSGLYVFTTSVKLLKNMMINITNNSRIEVFNDKKYKTTGNLVLENIIHTEEEENIWIMCKIHTKNFTESKKLHTLINNNEHFSYHIHTVGLWSVGTFLMFETKPKHSKTIFSTYVNNNLEVNEAMPLPDILIAVIDIETVSDNDYRIPEGNYIADHIFSVTLIINDQLYTLFNMPLSDQAELHKTQTILKSIECKDEPGYYKIKRRHCFTFNTERALLKKLLTLLDEIDEPYICLGYNSRHYDLPFLFARVSYLNMLEEIKNFKYINGITTYGKNMLHVDMNQLIVKYFRDELTGYSLKNVCKVLLEDDSTQKLDFDARNLRYIYKYIDENKHINNGYYDNVLCQQPKKWSVDLKTMVKYNEMDCIVVLTLWDSLQYYAFMFYASKLFFSNYTRTGLTKINEYLSSNMIYEGLQRNFIVTKHHNRYILKTSKYELPINTDTLNANDSYGGGFNYRCNRGTYDRIYAMDALAYYPKLIAGCNISHETAVIVSTQDFLFIVENNKEDFISENFDIIKFSTHKSIIKELETKNVTEPVIDIMRNLAPTAYIDNFIENAPIITFETVKKQCMPHELLVIIIKNKKGFLSEVINERNILRNLAKANNKNIKNHIELCETLLVDMKINNLDGANNNNDDDDDDFADDDGDDFADDDTTAMEVDLLETSDFNINNYVTPKMEDEKVYHVSPQLAFLTKQDFKKYKNPIEVLEMYIVHLKREFKRLNQHYRNQKLLNNSVYGLLGAQYGILKGRMIASIVTMLGRKYIVEAARIGNKMNGTCVYSDTDSVMFDLSNSSVNDKYIISKTAALNKHVILNSKVYTNMFILGKKTYIATHNEDVFSRGINKQGPPLWNFMMIKLYFKFIVNAEPLYFNNVFNVLCELYYESYESIKKDKKQILRTLNVQPRDSYKKATPITKLMDRIKHDMPNYTFGNKIEYFYKLVNDCSNVYFALDFELENTKLTEINLYKFYSHVIQTFYTIISFRIEDTIKKERNIVMKYSNSTFKRINKSAYLYVLDKISR